MSKQIETQPAAVPDGLHWGKYIKPYLLYFIAGPILMIVEVLGAVLFVTDQGRLAGDTECKLAQTVAAFLGKNMES